MRIFVSAKELGFEKDSVSLEDKSHRSNLQMAAQALVGLLPVSCNTENGGDEWCCRAQGGFSNWRACVSAAQARAELRYLGRWLGDACFAAHYFGFHGCVDEEHAGMEYLEASSRFDEMFSKEFEDDGMGAECLPRVSIEHAQELQDSGNEQDGAGKSWSNDHLLLYHWLSFVAADVAEIVGSAWLSSISVKYKLKQVAN